MKRITSVFLVIMLLLAGCSTTADKPLAESPGESADTTTRTITDVLGREIEIPTKIDTIICNGPGALRLICYAQAQDLVVGVEDVVNTYLSSIRCAYGYAFQDWFKDLPAIGKGGGRGYTAYEEEIITLQPDVILSAYSSEAIEELSAKTGIPVVCVTQYEGTIFDPEIMKSLELIGDILDKQERCQELISYMEEAKADLNNRTLDIADEDKLRAYTGAVTFGGGHGFGGTYGNFDPFTAINAINVSDEAGQDGGFVVDLEKIITWDPDVVFLDPANIELVNEEYAKKPGFFNSLRAIKERKVYSMICYIWYNTNIEMAIADTYYAGTVLFPEQFADIDIEKKTDELLEKFVGKAFYSDMKAAGLSFGEVKIGE